MAEVLPEIVGYIFSSLQFKNSKLHVPATAISLYKNADPWKNFKEIIALTDSEIQPDGIIDVKDTNTETPAIYNLNGKRLERPTRGLNIINGRKAVIK